ncbi:MAG: hypothetical protein HOH38_08500 [Nitrospinaceae bacterium]|nr:hypothetical protein [Nitrospina sp.]MBT5868864.1 hypothetical protein [Nitrospinaceae bacterium]
MFIYDSMTQGLELLANRELQEAENLFLKVITDPYGRPEETKQAKEYLSDIRDCKKGDKTLDFDIYKELVKQVVISFDYVDELLADIYFSPSSSYAEIDEELATRIPSIVSRLKQIKIRDISVRDKLFECFEKDGAKVIHERLQESRANDEHDTFDVNRYKTIFRKLIEQINPFLLERHLELLDYVLQTGEIHLLDDPKLTVLTPKYSWIIESTLNSQWYLLRSYFFKARAEIESQFNKKEGTRKYWEEVKYKKIKIFEECGFSEANIQKFLFTDKLNYKTLDEIHIFAGTMDQTLVPRDVSLALRGVEKAKDHIRERAGFLMGNRKKFQDSLLELGFSNKNSYSIAKQAKRFNNHQISEAFKLALKVTRSELFWYRIPPASNNLKNEIENQCAKHLSTVRIHLFERGRLNKILLQEGKKQIRTYLERIYGDTVSELHCYFRLETIHQYYKLKYFQYHEDSVPSVSELIKISRKEFQATLKNGYVKFISQKRLKIPNAIYKEIASKQSVTEWEDAYTTPEEKILLRFWFLKDYGLTINQKLIDDGVLKPGFDLWTYLKGQGEVCNS